MASKRRQRRKAWGGLVAAWSIQDLGHHLARNREAIKALDSAQ